MWRTLLVFFPPVLIGMLLQSLNGSVSALWIGRGLGTAALAGMLSASSMLFLLAAVVSGIGVAASILVGRSLGAGDSERARRIIVTGMGFLLFLSLPVAASGALATTIAGWLQVPEESRPFAVAYLQLMFLGTPFVYLLTFIVTVLRGTGDARTPFLFVALCVVLDIALNPLLIFGWGPVPRLGIAGSALATILAQATSLVLLAFYLHRRRPALWRLSGATALAIDRELMAALVSKGLPMGLQQIVVSSSMVAMVAIVNRFGVAPAAAFGACVQLWIYLQMPGMALGIAASTIAAHNVGAGRWDRVRELAVTGVLFNLGVTGGLVLLAYLGAHEVLGLFLPTGETLSMALHINAIVAWSFIGFGITFILVGIVRSTGAVLVPLIIIFIALWGVRVPFAYGFGLINERETIEAVWWSFPLGLITSVLLVLAYYRSGRWRSEREQKAVPAVAAVR
ncbi:MAG TPA: MATE family efflux transporter [Dongiaceae bacterium]|jgi:putative MATE family efflux protein|nr:MATE family efflux transporter [Dongiaceae bacterium]